jgi:hypothetical protein
MFPKPTSPFGLGWRIQARELVGTIIGDSVVLSVIYVFKAFHEHGGPERINLARNIILLSSTSCALIDVLHQAWVFFKTRRHEGLQWSVFPNLCLVYLAASIALALQVFGLGLYPDIPFSMGGGDTRQVIFCLGAKSALTTTFLERDGENVYTVPYELLLENENTYVVISPKDNQRSIEFDRKAVEEMVILGKRPPSAPAYFQRNVSESASSKFEVIERSQTEVPDFMAKGTHTKVNYVLWHDGHKCMQCVTR